MKLIIFSILLTISLAYHHEGEILVLDEKTFDVARDDFEFLMVNFCVSWIEACHKFDSEYNTVVSEMHILNPKVKFAKVDSGEEHTLGDKYHAFRYPTLKLFIRKVLEPLTYEGEKHAAELLSWLEKKSGPPSIEVHSMQEVENYKKDNDFVALFSGSTHSHAFNVFNFVANLHRDSTFLHIDNPGGTETITVFKKYDEEKSVFSGPFEAETVEDFIENHKIPVVHPYKHEANKKTSAKGSQHMLVLIKSSNDLDSSAESAFRSFAPDVKDKFFVTLANYEEEAGNELSERLGITKEDLPAVFILETKGSMTKYKVQDPITLENLRQFFINYVEKQLHPFHVSEPLPTNPYQNNVRHLVGKNFNEVVFDNDNDVIVDFYTDECDECDEILPVYESVAGILKDVSGLVLAKIDAAANELENVSLRRFPTLRLYQRDHKNTPIDFMGEKNEDQLIDFLKKHSRAEIKVKTKSELNYDL